MTLRRTRSAFLVVVLLLVGASACGGAVPEEQPAAGGGNAGEQATGGDVGNLAMLLPGPIQDADYNAVAYEALQTIAEEGGIETAYSENVAVVDAERVAREYITDGFPIVAFHGGQYLTIATQLATQFPDTQFIVESSGELAEQPENVWNIGRLFYPGYYVLGSLAASASQTGNVAFLGGIDIPDYKAGANAFFAGTRSVRPDIGLQFTFTGDQNDAVKGRQAAGALIDGGADVLVLGVNNAIFGVAEAAMAASNPVKLTGLYTDKSSIAPELFMTSMVFDFTGAYQDVLDQVADGQRSGYHEMRPGSGVSLSEIRNVDQATKTTAQQVFEQVASGEVTVEANAEQVVVPG
jgi:basic membrane protein A